MTALPVSPVELSSRLDLALALAREAGEITLGYFRRDDLQVDRKSDDSPVTVADRQAEAHLRAGISAAFPDDAILGEELGQRPGSSGFRWILDPIDGTKSFIHGVPLYGTMIGVEHQGESVLGVVRIPALNEVVYGSVGGGAWYICGDGPPRPARVAQTADLRQSLFLTSEVANFEHIGRRDAFDRLQAATRLTRTWGDCYGYLLVATGRADLMVDPLMNIWDAAALLPIIEQSGGRFVDWRGGRSISSGNGLACNPALLPSVLAILAGT